LRAGKAYFPLNEQIDLARHRHNGINQIVSVKSYAIWKFVRILSGKLNGSQSLSWVSLRCNCQFVLRQTRMGVMPAKLLHWAALLVAPLLLLFFASRHVVMHQREELSPGVGGGIAVFNDIDSRVNRTLRVNLITDKGLIAVPVPTQFEQLRDEIFVLPREAMLQELGERILAVTWVPREFNTFVDIPADVQPDAEGVPALSLEARYRPIRSFDPDPGDLALKLEGVQLELWGLDYDLDTSSLVSSRLRSVTVMGESDGTQ
jgi:hypothetical protein